MFRTNNFLGHPEVAASNSRYIVLGEMACQLISERFTDIAVKSDRSKYEAVRQQEFGEMNDFISCKKVVFVQSETRPLMLLMELPVLFHICRKQK